MYSVLSQWTLGTGRPWAAAVSLGIGALVTLAAHATLTASMGAVGAGWSIGLGVVVALVLLRCVRRSVTSGGPGWRA